MALTALAKSAQLAWAFLEQSGIDPEPLFREAKLDHRLIGNASARVDPRVLDALWIKIAATVDDPCFGIKLGSLWHPSYMHILGYAWLSSTTLRSAFKRLVRFSGMFDQSADMAVYEEGQHFVVTTGNVLLEEDYDWACDAMLAVITAMIRINMGEKTNPQQVTLRHAPPVCCGDYYEYFRCEVVFNASQDSLVLPTGILDQPLSGGNQKLARMHDQLMIDYVSKLAKKDIEGRTKATITQLLPEGKISDSEVAAVLHISSRTLQRKLKGAGTTFSSLLGEVRKEIAMSYLANSDYSLTELAFQLGYAETSSFSRAFKDWTGRTPSDYRLHH